MLRNWSAKIPAGPSLGRVISGTNRIGLLGADILAATGGGDYGAGIFANDQLDPAKRYRALLESSTFPVGALTVAENGSGEFTANGTASFGIFEDTVRLGASNFTGNIGGLLPLAGAGTSQANQASAAPVVQRYILAGLNVVGLAEVTAGPIVIAHNLGGAATTQSNLSPSRALLGFGPPPFGPGRYVLSDPRRLRVGNRRGQFVRIDPFSPKAPEEIVLLQFDFSDLTTEPAAPQVSVTWMSGAPDLNPTAMLSGAPLAQGDGLIAHLIQGGVLGADYLVTAQIDDPFGARYVLSGVLGIRRR